jgi:hypothetical protein
MRLTGVYHDARKALVGCSASLDRRQSVADYLFFFGK